MATQKAKKTKRPATKAATATATSASPKPTGKPTEKRTEKATAPQPSGLRPQVPYQAKKPGRAKVPFAKKSQPPSEAEFLARLPVAAGKKFDAVRSFLKKQKGVAEDLYFYGPKTGWAYRYLRGVRSLATIMIHDDHLMGIVSLDAAALAVVDFASQSEAGQRARRMAHGSPSLLWLDIPLDGPGASDFKALLKAKLKSLPPQGPPPPPPPPPRREGA